MFKPLLIVSVLNKISVPNLWMGKLRGRESK